MADTSSAATEKKAGSADDDTIQAVNLLAQGKRNLVVGDMVEAVGQLQEACRLLAGKFGETADECAEAYLAYGKALLDLARMESGVLGNALQGIDSDEESEEKSTTSDEKVDESDKMTAEEKEKLSDEIIEAMAEREEEKRATGEKSEKEGEGNGTVVNGSGNKEEEGDEKMDAEKMETEEVKDDKTKVEKKTEEIAKEPASDDKIEKDEKTDDKDEKEEKKEDNAGVDGKKGEIESKAAGDKAEGDEDKIPNGKETVEKEREKVKEKETEKANEEVVEKAAGDKEDKKDEEMECEDGKDEEDEGDESSVKEGDTEEEEAESEDIADEEGEEKDGEEKDGEKEGEKEAGDSKEEPDDDVSNLQLAWEVLELARTIYKKHDPKDMKLKLAETHLKLGEVGLETEQYDQAILDFKECLTIQKEYLEAEDRLLAETYYQLGLAYTFDKQYDPAIENFKSAASVIEAKIAKLKKILEDGEKEGKGKDLVDFDDPVYKARKEVAELEEILPDIMGKLEDVEDEKKNADRVKAAVMENVAMDFGTTTTGFGATTSAAPETAAKEVTNITHLVRKKRKPEDETIKEEDATKKLKTVEEGAGDASTKVNGKVNGTKTSPEKAMEADKKTKTVEDVKKTTEAAQTS